MQIYPLWILVRIGILKESKSQPLNPQYDLPLSKNESGPFIRYVMQFEGYRLQNDLISLQALLALFNKQKSIFSLVWQKPSSSATNIVAQRFYVNRAHISLYHTR